MSRKTARENLYKLVFEYLFNKDENSPSLEIITNSPDVSVSEIEYITSSFKGVISHYDELCDMIASSAHGFVIDRIYKPDLAALIIACYEMKYTDVPKRVAISEAVELVKSYSTEKSGAYVNGILASIYKKVEETEEK
ncbi:MAG: transcription antitermination factor NusB [Clostridia bacterium]|nr:transcription antitermination factor NusB [Clostridia bacterium]